MFNATLNGASLRGAAFDGASFRYTDFCNADLSEAKNLDQTLHFGPSTVGLDTLVRLRGNIPEPFLLGCGVPKRVIDSVLKAAGALEGIQRHSCFIYYADEDEAFARRLEKKLKLAGMSVYRAEEPKPPGYLMQGQISEAIDKCEKLIFVLSKASWEKHWVINDICRALKREREKKIEMLFPISLTPIEEIKRNLYHFVRDEGLARLIKEYCIPNYEDEKELEAGFERLLAGLRRSAERR